LKADGLTNYTAIGRPRRTRVEMTRHSRDAVPGPWQRRRGFARLEEERQNTLFAFRDNNQEWCLRMEQRVHFRSSFFNGLDVYCR